MSTPSHKTKGTCTTACSCPVHSPEQKQKNKNYDVVYADGNVDDRLNATTVKEMGESCWKNVCPPAHFPRRIQPISARKIDIVRAQLMERKGTPIPRKVDDASIGYYFESGKTKSGVSIQSFMSRSTSQYVSRRSEF